jgi:superoxide dismutase, Cu-Zn family
MMFPNRHSMLLLAALLLAACTQGADQQAGAPRQPDPASSSPPEKSNSEQPPHDAVVQLAPTQGSAVSGSLALGNSPHGVRISGAIQGLQPNSQFGFHIHEKGDCSAPDGSSAGEHFNPTKQPHGDPTGGPHHAGDMVNIRSNSEGVAQVDTTVRNVMVGTSQNSAPSANAAPVDSATQNAGGAHAQVLGKAMVVHARADDYTTQPSGNSGARIACGVITVQPTNTGSSEPAHADSSY